MSYKCCFARRILRDIHLRKEEKQMTVIGWIPIATRRKYQKKVCEHCPSRIRLGLHHIDNDRKNNAPENLLTLCPSCHTIWHWLNGKIPWKRLGNCKICDKPARRLDLCETHSSRYYRHGAPNLVKKWIGSSWQLVKVRG